MFPVSGLLLVALIGSVAADNNTSLAPAAATDVTLFGASDAASQKQPIMMMAAGGEDGSGIVVIAFAPTFSAAEGDVYEYAAIIDAGDGAEKDDGPLMLDVHQASCCRDDNGACHDWRLPAPETPLHRVTCHGLNISVEYRASVVARAANGTSIPVIVAQKKVVAVSKDEMALSEHEYMNLVGDVVEQAAGADDSSASEMFQRPIQMIMIGVAAMLCLAATFTLLRCMVRRRRRQCSLAAMDTLILPQYEPIVDRDDDVAN